MNQSNLSNLSTISTQTIEEFLVGKIYYDGVSYVYITEIKDNETFEYSTSRYTKLLEEIKKERIQPSSIIIMSVTDRIREIKKSKEYDINQTLLNDLINLFPEYII